MIAKTKLAAAVSAALGCCSVLAMSQAYAQDPATRTGAAGTAAQQNDAGNGDAGAGQLQEIVVTAERRSADIQTTPIAVTAISGAELQQKQVNDLQSIQNVAPALSIATNGSSTTVNMRGMGNPAVYATETSGVAIITDGFDNPSTLGLAAGMFDIADVEVLRGPQGTFIGANSTGGAIEVTSTNPNFRGLNGYALFKIGNYTDEQMQAAVNLPVSDTFAMRLAINAESRNSFYSLRTPMAPGQSTPVDDPGNLDQKDGRLSLLWKPNESFQALVKAQIDTNNTDGYGENVNPGTFTALPGVACPSGGTGICHAQGYPYYSGNPWVLNYQDPGDWRTKYWDKMGSIETRYTLPDDIVLRVFGAVDDVLNASNAGSYDSQVAGYSSSFVAPQIMYNGEINLISPTTGKFSWIAGAHWGYRKLPAPQLSYNYIPPYSPSSPAVTSDLTTIRTRQAAVFGQVSYNFTDALQLQVGVRENWDNNPNGGFFRTVIPNGPTIFLNLPGAYVGNTPTGKVDLNYQLTKNQFLYAFYARGYQPGAGSVVKPAAQPAYVNDDEIGWKSTAFGGHLRSDLGAYWAAYQGMQINLFNSAIGTGAQLQNLATATIKGLEAQEEAQFGPLGLDLNGAYTYSTMGAITTVPNYKFPNGFGNTPQCPAGQATSSTCTNYAPFEISLNGEEVPYAPKLTVTADIDYAIPVGSAALTPKLSLQHTDHQYGCVFQSDNYCYMGARNLWNANLDYVDGPWDAGLYGTNLTNQTYVSSNAGGTTVFYGNPRQYGLQVRYSY